MAETEFDSRALTEPVDPAEVRAYTRANPTRANTTVYRAIMVLALVGIVVFSFFESFSPLRFVSNGLSTIFSSGFGGLRGPFGWFNAVAVGAMLAIICVLALMLVKHAGVLWRLRVSARKRYRLSRFAQANGMTFEGEIIDHWRPGLLFGVGEKRRASLVLRRSQPRSTEFANYEFVTGT